MHHRTPHHPHHRLARNSAAHHAERNTIPVQVVLTAILLLLTPAAGAEPTPAALQAFAAYTTAVEHRLGLQHATPTHFLAGLPSTASAPSLRGGAIPLEQLHEPDSPTTCPGALLHHWRGTAFVPHAHAADFEHLLRDLPAYPQHFAPEVLRASVLTSSGDHLQTALRVRQHHGLTVTLDTTYDLTFSHPDPRHSFSTSRSLRITEIANANTPTEHPLSPADEHGFLLRLNTYWTWEERPEGLFLQVETVSLSRAIPTGLGWALRPYVESIPRDSLTFTLTASRNALTAVSH